MIRTATATRMMAKIGIAGYSPSNGTRGLAATTDSHGRYHITCAIVPQRITRQRLRHSSSTIARCRAASGSSTRPGPDTARATRGKALKINFGASIHRVVGLDVADAVFEPGSVEMRPTVDVRALTCLLQRARERRRLRTAPLLRRGRRRRGTRQISSLETTQA